MKNKKKEMIYYILVVLWMGVIFFLSSRNAPTSEVESKSITNIIVDVTNSEVTGNERYLLVKKVNHIVRKCAHFTEYLILGLLVYLAIKNSSLNIKHKYVVTVLICFLYACSDEFHQYFIDGRSAQFTDVLIDTMGGFTFIVLNVLKNKILIKKNK